MAESAFRLAPDSVSPIPSLDWTCGAIPNKQRIGDVLVANQIIDYDKQRVQSANNFLEEEIVFQGVHAPVGPLLLDRFANILNWSFPLPDGRTARSDTGPILAGDKLIDHSGFKTRLTAQFPQAIGGEMEGVGLWSASARHGKDWILVKAICDWAESKGDSHQELAAAAAVSLALEALKSPTALTLDTVQVSRPHPTTAILEHFPPVLFIHDPRAPRSGGAGS